MNDIGRTFTLPGVERVSPRIFTIHPANWSGDGAADFWDTLSGHEQERIEQGLRDSESGRYTPVHRFLASLLNT